MTGNSVKNADTEVKTFPGKIALITSDEIVGEDYPHATEHLTAKHGREKFIHLSWPVNFMTEQQKLIDTVTELAADREIKAIIFNQALPGSNAAVDKLKETRDDIFIIYCLIQEDLAESAARANLIFRLDGEGMAEAMVKQAKKQGAKVFVHYSFPRHMSLTILSSRRNLIQEACVAEGIQFVDATAPDPTGEAGVNYAQEFILKDVPKMTARYGEDTAFYSSNCHLQAPLIRAVIDCHAIYPQPCCPSPLHGFPKALGIETTNNPDSLNYVITEASRIAEEKNMTDRLSTWPVPAALMFTNAGAEYAIKWIKDEVPKNHIDDEVLSKCMNTYIKEVVGEAIEVTMTSGSEKGIIYDNVKMIFMGYLDF